MITLEQILGYCEDMVEDDYPQPSPLTVKRDLHSDGYLVCYTRSGREIIKIEREADDEKVFVYARILGLSNHPLKA
jgi:hypothetical protein